MMALLLSNVANKGKSNVWQALGTTAKLNGITGFYDSRRTITFVGQRPGQHGGEREA